MFPPNIWAEFFESFYAKLNGLFYTSHPNIYIFIDAFKEVQSSTYIQEIGRELVKKSKHNAEKENIL